MQLHLVEQSPAALRRLTVERASAALAVTNSTTLGTGTISGFGTFTGAVDAGSNAGHVTADGGTLIMASAVTGTALVLTASGSGDTVRLDTSGNTAKTVALNGGTLLLNGSARLTVTDAIAIGSGHVNLAGTGSLLTDSNGVTLTGGSLIGSGNVSLDTYISGNGTVGISVVSNTVTASGGPLNLTGAMDDSTVLAINDVSGSVLKINYSGASINALSVDTANKTLEIAQSATILGTQTVSGGGTLTVDSGAVLADTSGITLSGGTLSGAGGITAGTGVTGSGTVSMVLSNPSTITASGGVLDLTRDIDSNSGVSFNIASDPASILKVSGVVGTNNTFTFGGTLGALELNAVTVSPGGLNFAGTVSNLHVGTSGSFNPASTNYVNVQTAAITSITITDSTHFDIYNGATDLGTVTLGTALDPSTYVDFTADIGALGGYDVFLSDAICFMAGTMVRTPEGEVAVETLKPGDLVMTIDGVAKPMNWLGRQTVSARFADPLRSWPIRIKAGALDANVPSRDLRISPDHALLVQGVLVQAGSLVNGTSIVREPTVPDLFVYYHVELDDHSLILAEGTPAETFVDNVDRLNFDNWAEFEALYPEGKTVEELPYPRAKAWRQVPVYVRIFLAERAQIIGATSDDAMVA